MRRSEPPSGVLDIVYLVQQTFGDRALERELLGLFEQQCVRLLPAIAGESPAMGRSDAAHMLKGAARAVGAVRIAALGDALERALDQGAAADVLAPLVRKLDAAIGDVRAAIELRCQTAA